MPRRAQSTNILDILTRFPDGIDLSGLQRATRPPRSRRTLQRQLKALIDAGEVTSEGRGRASRYSLVRRAASPLAPARDYSELLPLSPESREIIRYVSQPLAARRPVDYDRELLHAYRPNETPLLSPVTCEHLHRIGATGGSGLPAGTYGRAILDRLLIDLSWASSRLEGNTYSLLDTARLIQHGQTATGKDAQETQMILNHKRAIELLVDDAGVLGFNRYSLLNLHGLLSENLLIDRSASGRLRARPVEVAQSAFLPVNVPQVIEEVFDDLLDKAGRTRDPFEQALLMLVHLPYLQPFEDVNKRVSRIAANISLIQRNLCPLTFLDVPDRAYVDAVLGIYEMGRTELMRDLFVWAYERSTQKYLQVQGSLAQPDPLRLKYHAELHQLVGEIVRSRRPADQASLAHGFAEERVAAPDRELFVTIVLDEVARLHLGVLARYRLRPSELEAWNEALRA